MSDLSYLEGVEENTKSAMDEIMQYVHMLDDVRAKREGIEHALSDIKESERKLAEEVIPQMMFNYGLDQLRLSNGVTVTIKDDVKASVPKDAVKKQVALDWLRNNGAADLIKDTVTIEGADDAIVASLNEQHVAYTRDLSVNTNSLNAWFKERFGIKKGSVASLDKEDVPPELNVYRYTTTVVK